jgi:hypothetical protein
MTSRLTDIAPRLKKLLLMLSSDQPGEVVNAARAIDATLRGAGADWHELVGRLTAAPVATRDRHEGRDVSWRAMHEFCARHGDLLQLREWDFVHDLEHWRGNLTERQHAWLFSIYARIRRAA